MESLVDYSSSEASDEEKSQLAALNITLPMLLPAQDNSSTNIRDCPQDHQMRSRSFEHCEGNWATHVYIDCPLSECLRQGLRNIFDKSNNLHLIESTHVSLSKTFVLKFHWIENFFTSLRQKFKDSSTKFMLQLSSNVVYFANEDRSRHFACILATEWCNPVLSVIIEKVDSSLKEFNLPLYYEDPSAHVSVIWKLSEFTESEKSQISTAIKKIMEEHNEVLNIWVDKISVKSGNKLIEIPI